MALYTYHHDAPRVTEAGRRWVQACLADDRSVLADEALGTAENFEALHRHFVLRLLEGSASFYEKLTAQLSDAPPDARKLMAELLWALFLFPSNISPATKREAVVNVWAQSGESLPQPHPLLDDATLDGIGSAGMGVNTNRWRELNYMIAIGRAIKSLPAVERAPIFADYDRFMAWIATVPQEGDRQFRHMLRYFLFPERVERMSSNGDRIRVLSAYGVAPRKVLRKWSDRQLDDALLTLRRDFETKLGTTDLDFYLEPLRARWQPGDTGTPEEEPDGVDKPGVAEPTAGYVAERPRNVIYYGPPGTGKTWRLQQLLKRYVDLPADVERSTWAQQLVARRGWRVVIAAALADLRHATPVPALAAHPLIRAKVAQRKPGKVFAILWSYLQSHSSADSLTVGTATRAPPSLFDKTASSGWFLVPEWSERDAEAAELAKQWHDGPGEAGEVRRYRMVTFHPSYSYEDFVVGLRPVAAADGTTSFRLVDGAFKQICDDARANPSRRYALFIDEINRANIAKVFGELITLIELDKRGRYGASGELIAGIEVQLPGTGGEESEIEPFSVPANLDVYGTMNTADRSIALLDIALRRRFEFEEIGPDYRVLDRTVEGVHLGRLLSAINDRLEFLADRDRRIGHAYFTQVDSIAGLRAAFLSSVIPLLQEYFFDDWSQVERVLATDGERSRFIRRDMLNGQVLWPDASIAAAGERARYLVAPDAEWDAAAFAAIYRGA